MDQLLTIEVLGQPFTFKADSNVANVKAVADYVSKTVDAVGKQSANKNPSVDGRAILILTALNITKEYLELKQKHQKLLEDINQRSANLLVALETQLT